MKLRYSDDQCVLERTRLDVSLLLSVEGWMESLTLRSVASRARAHTHATHTHTMQEHQLHFFCSTCTSRMYMIYSKYLVLFFHQCITYFLSFEQ